MNLTMKAVLAAALLLAPSMAMAQKPVTISDAITESFTIEAINSSARIVTLRDKDGFLEDGICGPEGPMRARGAACSGTPCRASCRTSGR